MLGASSDSESSWNRYGQKIECELCGEARNCTTRGGLVTCEDCQAEFLPSSGLL